MAKSHDVAYEILGSGSHETSANRPQAVSHERDVSPGKTSPAPSPPSRVVNGCADSSFVVRVLGWKRQSRSLQILAVVIPMEFFSGLPWRSVRIGQIHTSLFLAARAVFLSFRNS